MKREKYTYDKTYQWETLIEAENIATNHKLKKWDIKQHAENRIKNLCNIQQQLINGTMQTSRYKHMQRRSTSGKIRDISYLDFNPNQIYHQSQVVAGNDRIEKHLIKDTYASRIGKGQTAGALRVEQWLKEDPENTIWYGQGDITKYFDNIPHKVAENILRKLFKSEKYIQSLLEPVYKFGDKGVPLGIRPSQILGNLVLSEFDHWAKEEMGMKYYIRYMDDFVVLCKTKGEAKHFMKKAGEKLAEIELVDHTPKIHRVAKGLDYLGYVFYEGGDMYWRRKNKAEWLKRRSKVTNKRRLKEIDDAAWGMLKHGNKHCKKLFKMKTGRSLKDLGLEKLTNTKDKNGKKFFDAPSINASVVLNNTIDVIDWEKGIKTKQGKDRWVLLIVLFGKQYRLIVNSLKIKSFIEMLESKKITSFRTEMIDTSGNKHYDFNFDKTIALSINNKEIN